MYWAIDVSALEIAIGIATTVLALTIGIAAAVLRHRRSIPLPVRVLPFAIGAAIPIAGTIGTVLGLRRAFGAVAGADPSAKAALLAEGISEAMNWTALGLICGTAFGIGVVIGELVTRRRRPAGDR